jgi:hypothetical protein
MWGLDHMTRPGSQRKTGGPRSLLVGTPPVDLEPPPRPYLLKVHPVSWHTSLKTVPPTHEPLLGTQLNHIQTITVGECGLLYHLRIHSSSCGHLLRSRFIFLYRVVTDLFKPLVKAMDYHLLIQPLVLVVMDISVQTFLCCFNVICSLNPNSGSSVRIPTVEYIYLHTLQTLQF